MDNPGLKYVGVVSPDGFTFQLDIPYAYLNEEDGTIDEEKLAEVITYVDGLLRRIGCVPVGQKIAADRAANGHKPTSAPTSTPPAARSTASGTDGVPYQMPSGAWACDPHGPMKDGRYGPYCSKRIGTKPNGDALYCSAKGPKV